MEKLIELMMKYLEEGFDIKTNQIGNTLHVIIYEPNGEISEEFDIIKISKN